MKTEDNNGNLETRLQQAKSAIDSVMELNTLMAVQYLVRKFDYLVEDAAVEELFRQEFRSLYENPSVIKPTQKASTLHSKGEYIDFEFEKPIFDNTVKATELLLKRKLRQEKVPDFNYDWLKPSEKPDFSFMPIPNPFYEFREKIKRAIDSPQTEKEIESAKLKSDLANLEFTQPMEIVAAKKEIIETLSNPEENPLLLDEILGAIGDIEIPSGRSPWQQYIEAGREEYGTCYPGDMTRGPKPAKSFKYVTDSALVTSAGSTRLKLVPTEEGPGTAYFILIKENGSDFKATKFAYTENTNHPDMIFPQKDKPTYLIRPMKSPFMVHVTDGKKEELRIKAYSISSVTEPLVIEPHDIYIVSTQELGCLANPKFKQDIEASGFDPEKMIDIIGSSEGEVKGSADEALVMTLYAKPNPNM